MSVGFGSTLSFIGFGNNRCLLSGLEKINGLYLVDKYSVL
jgi:hypothetical protein